MLPFLSHLIQFIQQPEVSHNVLSGLSITVKITMLSTLLAAFVGVLTVFTRTQLGHIPLFNWLSRAYVSLFRNTPLLLHLYLFYRGLQSIGINLTEETCGVLALGLYTGAYVSEILRSGFLAIPRTQWDSGQALGLSAVQVFFWVTLPQAIRYCLPALGNQSINLMKNSSLVAFITVEDLFFTVYRGAVNDFRPVEYFIVGASLYITLSLLIGGIIHGLDYCLERRWLRFPQLLGGI